MEGPADIVPAGLERLIQTISLSSPSNARQEVASMCSPSGYTSTFRVTEAAVFLSAYINGIRDYLRALETHCADD